ncbi:MAG: hypothetical protein AAF717_07550 [Bacteroidota bacterium]
MITLFRNEIKFIREFVYRLVNAGGTYAPKRPVSMEIKRNDKKGYEKYFLRDRLGVRILTFE